MITKVIWKVIFFPTSVTAIRHFANASLCHKGNSFQPPERCHFAKKRLLAKKHHFATKMKNIGSRISFQNFFIHQSLDNQVSNNYIYLRFCHFVHHPFWRGDTLTKWRFFGHFANVRGWKVRPLSIAISESFSAFLFLSVINENLACILQIFAKSTCPNLNSSKYASKIWTLTKTYLVRKLPELTLALIFIVNLSTGNGLKKLLGSKTNHLVQKSTFKQSHVFRT